tara:strand:- start:1598 stop:2638 length:1041 start_codon:yes stop_codon:yes gene_type:complete
MEIEHGRVETARHKSAYLVCGPVDGPRIYFVHGWPELSLSWRHQLLTLGNLGFRAIAPDMRGYGNSSNYSKHKDFALSEAVQDMVELHAALGDGPAVWVGHDWGAPVVWSVALHYPEIVHALANLCVPLGLEAGVDSIMEHVDRNIYPAETFPKGQWEYQFFYNENFTAAQTEMEANPLKTVKLLFRKGDPAGAGQPASTAYTRINGGWFGSDGIPDMEVDLDIISANEADIFAEALGRNSFFGPSSWYVNHDYNAAFSAKVRSAPITKPVLFFHGEYDYVCQTATGTLADPMRARCSKLTEVFVKSGHWMAQERPIEVNAGLTHWLICNVGYWPETTPSSKIQSH